MKHLFSTVICSLILIGSLVAQDAGITIGDSNGTTNGTIKYNSTSGFQGLHLGNWMPFTGTTGASPWTVSGANIYFDGPGTVGIGGLSDGPALQVNGVITANMPGSSTGAVSFSSPIGLPGVIFRSNDNSSRADIRFATSGLHLGAHGAVTPPITSLVLANNGRVGIGTTTPIQKLHVNGTFRSNTIFVDPQNSTSEGGEVVLYGAGSNNDYHIDNFDGGVRFFHSGGVAMEITDNYKIKLGPVTSTPGNFRLYVATGILTERVKIATMATADWADYVFDEDYKLNSLHEVKSFVQKNKHLPNIPSAQEIEKSGYELQKMDAKLLEKIEELYLLTIQLDEEKQQIEANNIKLQQENELLKTTQQNILTRLSKLEHTH